MLKPLACLAVSGLILMAGCSSGSHTAKTPTPTPSASRSAPVVRTSVLSVRPTGPQGELAKGWRIAYAATATQTCWGSDFAVAYRCDANNGIYDPCWRLGPVGSDGRSVVCPIAPWGRVAARIDLPPKLAPLGSLSTEPEKQAWGYAVSGGPNCLVSLGARDMVGTHVVTYICNENLLLLDQPDKSTEPWTVKTMRVTTTGSNVATPDRKILVAYWATPDSL